jgi:hypothetical protein
MVSLNPVQVKLPLTVARQAQITQRGSSARYWHGTPALHVNFDIDCGQKYSPQSITKSKEAKRGKKETVDLSA